jgi:L-glyceraldehyde 3-phosphate reductase
MINISENRYNKMLYRRCGKSGIKLPAISLVYGITSVV